jgi:transcriptional regulator with XRE-family HTH domain
LSKWIKRKCTTSTSNKENKNELIPNPVNIHIGNKIKTRRIAMGISEEEFGEMLGVSVRKVHAYEQGINRVDASHFITITQVLDAPVAYFFEGLEFSATDQKETKMGNRPVSRSRYAISDGFIYKGKTVIGQSRSQNTAALEEMIACANDGARMRIVMEAATKRLKKPQSLHTKRERDAIENLRVTIANELRDNGEIH